jgi:hypothetical protein
MALKMAGCALSVNSFIRYYEMHFHKKMVIDRRTKVEMVNHYRSYNFVLKRRKGQFRLFQPTETNGQTRTSIGFIIVSAVTKTWLRRC